MNFVVKKYLSLEVYNLATLMQKKVNFSIVQLKMFSSIVLHFKFTNDAI